MSGPVLATGGSGRRDVGRACRVFLERVLVRAALGLALALAGAAAVQAQEPGLAVFSLPDKNWGVGLSLQNFIINESRTYPDGKARLVRADRQAEGMILTVFIAPAAGEDSARACRDAFWQRLQNGPAASSYRDVRQSVSGDMGSSELASSEYVIGEIQGIRIDQKHVHAYFGREGSCIEIHLSKTLFEPKDQELFAAVLRTVRLVEANAAPVVQTIRTYRVSSRDAVELTMPPAWQDEFPGGRENAGPTLSLLPATTKDVLSLLTVLVPPTEGRDGSYNAPDKLRKRTEAAGQRLLEKSTEDKLRIEEVKGPEVTGYMFTITDKNPGSGPWDFRHVTHAEAGLRDVTLSFSLFFQAPGVPDRAAALEVFKNARLIAVPPSR
jgi:hypothetical protein